MMEHLSATVDEYAQSEIIRRILEIIDRHSSDPHWSFSVVNDLMLKSTSSALPSCIHFIKKLVYGGAIKELFEAVKLNSF